VTELTVDALFVHGLNITEHLLTDNELFFSFVYFTFLSFTEMGVGMGIKVVGMVWDGYKYLSPCMQLST